METAMAPKRACRRPALDSDRPLVAGTLARSTAVADVGIHRHRRRDAGGRGGGAAPS
jgi:hypothetical protein